MEINVGMYARTIKGIVKINKIENNIMTDTNGYLHYGDFINASFNIIDLIEVGDFIKYSKDNLHICYPCRVWAKSDENMGKILMVEDNKLSDVNIDEILTHEQFESNAYVLEKER